jgi:tetratricopeptide (TPR) repeat protein
MGLKTTWAALMLGLEIAATSALQQANDPLATARVLIQQDRNQEAITELKRLAALDPKAKGVNHELGVAYYHQGGYLEAAQYLEKALEEDPNDRDAAQLIGLSYYSIGRPADAIPALEKVHAWHPDANIDAIYILGICYALTKRCPEARRTFAKLYRVPEDSAAAHLMLASILVRQGFDPVAEAETRAALELAPQLPLAHFTLGELCVYKANYARALAEYKAELAINPGYAPALSHLGEVYWRLNRYDESEDVLQQAIWLDSTSAEPYVILGKVYFKKRQWMTADRMLQRAITVESGNYTAHYFLGQVYKVMGKLEAAEHEMSIATRLQQKQGMSQARVR